MSEKAIKRLQEQLNCPICLETYTDPKLLQCFHVFCRRCLVPLGVRDQQDQLTLTCPNCRQVTPIPARGVAGLQSAFHINPLLEILKDSIKKLENPAVTPEEAVGGTTVNSPCNVVQCCFEHAEEELKLYCETCGELICYHCIMKTGKHHDHDYARFKCAFEEYQKEITSSLEPMEKQVTIIKKALAEVNTHCGEISDQQAAIQDNIHITFRRLREVLTDRETELIGQLHNITQGKLKGLAAQRNQIETTLAQLMSCLHFMGKSLRTGNEKDVLMMKTNTVQQVKELTNPFQPDMLKPNTEADMVFSALADMTAMCQNYGQVFAPGLPDPANCHITSKGLEVAVVGEKSTAILQAINLGGKPCEEPIKLLECEVVSEITSTKGSCSVERRQSQYDISYQPTIKGRHQLHVKVEGQHIRGNPFSVVVLSSVKTLGTPIFTIGGLEGPWGVAINKRGEVVVTENRGHCVSVFSPGGKKLRSFGTRGSGHGQFIRPKAVAVDGEGNILVADFDNHRIQKFTAEGQFLTAVGTKGNGPLQFDRPTGIAFNAMNSKVYVVEWGNDRCQILNSDFTFWSSFGKPGNGKGEFHSPGDIACDNTGKVFVADYYNFRIQIFTSQGKFLRMISQGIGDLWTPIRIAVDPNGMVYVSDASQRVVSVFTSEGRFVTSFGQWEEGPAQVDFPCGLAVDSCVTFPHPTRLPMQGTGNEASGYGTGNEPIDYWPLNEGDYGTENEASDYGTGNEASNCGVVYVCDFNLNRVLVF